MLKKGKKKRKLTVADFERYREAIGIVNEYKELKPNKNVDFSDIFVQKLKKDHLRRIDNCSSVTYGFMHSLCFVPEMLAEEFEVELTPKFIAFLKKERLGRYGR
jgi:hypothetical protein